MPLPNSNLTLLGPSKAMGPLGKDIAKKAGALPPGSGQGAERGGGRLLLAESSKVERQFSRSQPGKDSPISIGMTTQACHHAPQVQCPAQCRTPVASLDLCSRRALKSPSLGFLDSSSGWFLSLSVGGGSCLTSRVLKVAGR